MATKRHETDERWNRVLRDEEFTPLEELGPRTLRAVTKARLEFNAGKYKTLDEVKRGMGL